MSNISVVSPQYITQSYLSHFLALRRETDNLQDTHLDCNCSNLRFVDPLGLCLLKHWFVDLSERGVTIALHHLPLFIESFMRRMDLFKDMAWVKFDDRTSGYGRNDATGQLIELHTLNDPQDIGASSMRIAEAISHGIPDIDFSADPDGMESSQGEKLQVQLEYVFSEILLNALDHGRKRNYGHAHTNIAAQYYPRTKALDVAILDNGCGLFETLQAHEQMDGDLTDSKAIEIALRPRVSCNRDAALGLDTRNQGIGLTVSSSMAVQAGGFYSVFSGAASRTVYANGQTSQEEIPYWRGTGVTFRFPKAGLLTVNRSEIITALPQFRRVKSLNFG